MKVYRLWVLFEPNFLNIIWEHEYAFDEIPILISSTWNKHYFFEEGVGGVGGGVGGGAGWDGGVGGGAGWDWGWGGRCVINFTGLIYFMEKNITTLQMKIASNLCYASKILKNRNFIKISILHHWSALAAVPNNGFTCDMIS